MSEQTTFDAHMRDLEVIGGPDFGPRLLRRFVRHMERMVSAAAGAAPSTAEAHSTAGLAGMFGFREAGNAWNALEKEAPSAQDLARALDASSRCLALARRRLCATPFAD